MKGKTTLSSGEEWLLQYGDRIPPGVARFARLHHRRYFLKIGQNNLTLLLYHADNLVAAGDRLDPEGIYDYRGTPLASVFSRVSLAADGFGPQQFLPLQPLGPDMLVPCPLGAGQWRRCGV